MLTAKLYEAVMSLGERSECLLVLGHDPFKMGGVLRGLKPLTVCPRQVLVKCRALVGGVDAWIEEPRHGNVRIEQGEDFRFVAGLKGADAAAASS